MVKKFLLLTNRKFDAFNSFLDIRLKNFLIYFLLKVNFCQHGIVHALSRLSKCSTATAIRRTVNPFKHSVALFYMGADDECQSQRIT